MKPEDKTDGEFILKPTARRRWRLTGRERWSEVFVATKTNERAKKGQVYLRETTTTVYSEREVELECGHWTQYRYDGGMKYVTFCAQCDGA
jgi:hypothetical protein